MTKILVSVAFAIDLDEDELVDFVSRIDQSILDGIKAKLDDIPAELDETEVREKFDAAIDYYGASFTPRRDMLEGIW